MFDAAAEQAKALEDYPPFVYADLAGKVRELPNVMTLPGAVVQRLNRSLGHVAADEESMTAAEADQALRALLDELSPGSADAISEMPPAVSARLIQAWTDMMDEAGKSVSPPSPRNREERRSRKTAKSGGSTPAPSGSTS